MKSSLSSPLINAIIFTLAIAWMPNESRCATQWPEPGSLDLGFNAGDIMFQCLGGYPPIIDMTLDKDGRIYVGGHFTSIQRKPRGGLARLLPDGSLDDGFRATITTREDLLDIHQVMFDHEGNILAGWGMLHRYIAEGKTIPGFISPCDVLAIDHIGRIWAADDLPIDDGCRSSVYGTGLGRFLPDGSVDIHYGQPYASYTKGIILADNAFITGVGMTANPGEDISLALQNNTLVKITASGVIDDTFHPPMFNKRITNIVADPVGRIYVGGHFDQVDSRPSLGLVRLFPDGTLDERFKAPGRAWGDVPMAVQPDFKLLIWATIDSNYGVWRLEQNGSIDTNFNSKELSGVLCDGGRRGLSHCKLLLQPDGKILLSGNFSTYDGVRRESIVRIHGDSGPYIAWVQAGDGYQLYWGRGKLQQSTSLDGPWEEMPVESPLPLSTSVNIGFFRTVED